LLQMFLIKHIHQEILFWYWNVYDLENLLIFLIPNIFYFKIFMISHVLPEISWRIINLRPTQVFLELNFINEFFNSLIHQFKLITV
jgi:hypothetical protein